MVVDLVAGVPCQSPERISIWLLSLCVQLTGCGGLILRILHILFERVHLEDLASVSERRPWQFARWPPGEHCAGSSASGAAAQSTLPRPESGCELSAAGHRLGQGAKRAAGGGLLTSLRSPPLLMASADLRPSRAPARASPEPELESRSTLFGKPNGMRRPHAAQAAPNEQLIWLASKQRPACTSAPSLAQ